MGGAEVEGDRGGREGSHPNQQRPTLSSVTFAGYLFIFIWVCLFFWLSFFILQIFSLHYFHFSLSALHLVLVASTQTTHTLAVMAKSSPSAPQSTQLPPSSSIHPPPSCPPPSLLQSCQPQFSLSIAPTTLPSLPLLLSPSVTPLLRCNNKHPIQLSWYMTGVSSIACCRAKRGESVGRLGGSGSQVMCPRLDNGGLRSTGKFHLCQVFAF